MRGDGCLVTSDIIYYFMKYCETGMLNHGRLKNVAQDGFDGF